MLVHDHSDGAYAVSVPCLTCGRTVRLCDAWIDPNGPAFKAYYHEGCEPNKPKATGCERDGCKRDHGRADG